MGCNSGSGTAPVRELCVMVKKPSYASLASKVASHCCSAVPANMLRCYTFLIAGGACIHEVVAGSELEVAGRCQQTQQRVDTGKCGRQARVAEQSTGCGSEVLLLRNFVREHVARRGGIRERSGGRGCGVRRLRGDIVAAGCGCIRLCALGLLTLALCVCLARPNEVLHLAGKPRKSGHCACAIGVSSAARSKSVLNTTPASKLGALRGAGRGEGTERFGQLKAAGAAAAQSMQHYL